MKTIASLGLSKCHKAEVIVVGMGDFSDNDEVGTMHYECTKCDEACDLWNVKKPKITKTWMKKFLKLIKGDSPHRKEGV